MQRSESFQLSFSFDHPITILNTLRTTLQQILANPALHTPKIQAYLDMRSIYLIDAHQGRAAYLARLLNSLGFQPLVTSTLLEAYTLYLQGFTVPFTLLVSQGDVSQRFFLQRLAQHMLQKYHYDIPIIYLYSTIPATPLLPAAPTPRLALPPPAPQPKAQISGPLPRPVKTTPLSSNKTMPLSQSQNTPPAPKTMPSIPKTMPLPPLAYLEPIPRKIETSQLEDFTDNETNAGGYFSLAGQNLGRYQIVAPLGRNPHSNVYQIYDRLRESHVALKALPMKSALPQDISDTGEEEYNPFEHEKNVISQLEHPNITSTLNFGKSYISGIPFIYKTMPYFVDGSLDSWLYERQSMIFPPKDVLTIITQIGDALQYAHEHHLLYQNFKFTNILISKTAKNLRGLKVQLSDFTIDQTQTIAPKTKSCFPYVAPERWQGQLFPASDQYGLAAMAYELLAGRPLFQGQSASIVKHLHLNMAAQAPSSFNPATSSALDRVILRALAKRPEERFASVRLFVKAFQQSC